jgi:hypothetical protein
MKAEERTPVQKEIDKFREWLRAQPDAPRRSAEIVPWPKPLSEMEQARRQAVIDATWERVQFEKKELERAAARRCHRGPGEDPPYPKTEVSGGYDPFSDEWMNR